MYDLEMSGGGVGTEHDMFDEDVLAQGHRFIGLGGQAHEWGPVKSHPLLPQS